jgi:hypothetical protein
MFFALSQHLNSYPACRRHPARNYWTATEHWGQESDFWLRYRDGFTEIGEWVLEMRSLIGWRGVLSRQDVCFKGKVWKKQTNEVPDKPATLQVILLNYPLFVNEGSVNKVLRQGPNADLTRDKVMILPLPEPSPSEEPGQSWQRSNVCKSIIGEKVGESSNPRGREEVFLLP